MKALILSILIFTITICPCVTFASPKGEVLNTLDELGFDIRTDGDIKKSVFNVGMDIWQATRLSNRYLFGDHTYKVFFSAQINRDGGEVGFKYEWR